MNRRLNGKRAVTDILAGLIFVAFGLAFAITSLSYELGTAPVPADRATPEAHSQQLQEQIELWGQVIQEAGVKAS